MPVTTVLLLRHGHRLAWMLDPSTGEYTSSHPYPTKLPADPPLASHGVSQSQETGAHLSKLLLPDAREDKLRIYTSLFYRCPQTLRPTVEGLQLALDAEGSKRKVTVRGERGVGEWFGHAPFLQPEPADAKMLRKWFPWMEDYESLVVPDRHGERIETLHQRVAKALQAVIQDVEREYREMGRSGDEVTILIAGHAAQIICSGRALTGQVPDDLDLDDFYCFTCGISRFERRREGALGSFKCIANSDCSHLSQGEERGWKFHGDESFDSYAEAQGKGIKESDGSFGSKL